MKKLSFVVFMLWLLSFALLLGCGQEVTPTTTTTTTTLPTEHWSGRIVSTTETVSSKKIYCTGNISIESGGSLTFNHAHLYVSCESAAQYGIFVKSGGTLNVTNESLIAAHTSHGYAFWYKSGSHGAIHSSTVEATWTPSTEGKSQHNEAGIFIEAENFKVTNSTIKNSKGNGIETYNAHHFHASGSSFVSNEANGLLLCASSGTVEASMLSSNRLSGLYIEGTAETRVYSNTMNSNHTGLKIFTNTGTISIESNTLQNNTAYGFHIDNASPMFYRNTVKGSPKAGLIRNTYGDPHPIFGDNNISNSGYNNFADNTIGIQNDTLIAIKAENNYWGYFSIGAIAGYNNDVNATFDVAPWLSEAP